MTDNKTIYGNISSIRNTLLDKMKEYIGYADETGSFVPDEIAQLMLEVTCETNKEIAIFKELLDF